MGADPSAVPNPVLAADGVVKRYGGVAALDGVSLASGAGECVALVGESGSGKTTLLRCFNRMTEPDAGRVTVEGAHADPATLPEPSLQSIHPCCDRTRKSSGWA